MNIKIKYAYLFLLISFIAFVINTDELASCNGKSIWPELLGKNVENAVNLIKTENSYLEVIKVQKGSMVTMDYRLDRVRVFYDVESNLVVEIPRIG